MNEKLDSRVSFFIKSYPDRNYCRIKIVGPINREILTSIFENVMSHPEYTPGMNRFWDFTETDAARMTSGDWKTYATVVKSLETQPGKVKAVALVSSDLEYGMIRVFQAVGDGTLPSDTMVTRSEEEAEEWITSAKTNFA